MSLSYTISEILQKNLVKFGHVVPEICVQIYKETHTETDMLITILNKRTEQKCC